MTAESATDRQRRWELVVRRSFEISDLVSHDDARRILIGQLQAQLEENGWQSPTRGTAEPIVDALMALGANEEIVDHLLPVGTGYSVPPFTTRDAAYRLLDRGLTVVDPEHLVFDPMSELPPEVVGTAQQVLDRICDYVRKQPWAIDL